MNVAMLYISLPSSKALYGIKIPALIFRYLYLIQANRISSGRYSFC